MLMAKLYRTIAPAQRPTHLEVLVAVILERDGIMFKEAPKAKEVG